MIMDFINSDESASHHLLPHKGFIYSADAGVGGSETVLELSEQSVRKGEEISYHKSFSN